MTGVALAAVALAVAATGCATSNAGPARDAATGSCRPVAVSVDNQVTPLPAPVPALPAVVVSADGRRVTVRDVSRVIAVNLYGSLGEIVYGLGLGDRLAGRDRSTAFDGVAHLPVVTGNGHDLNAEAVLALDPTVVITDDTIGPRAVLDQIRAAGVPVVLLDGEQSVNAVPRHVREVARALGIPEAGERLAARVATELRAARATSNDDPPVVAFLYLRGTAGVYLLGGNGAGSDDLIEAAGGIDAGSRAGLERFRPVTSEALAAAAPDVLLVMTKSLESVGGVDGLVNLPGVAQTPAARRRRVVTVDDEVLLSFGVRTPRVVAALAGAFREDCA